MSASPNAMQSLLAQKLMQSQGPQSYGGGAAGPQMQARGSPLTGASDIAQKLMLIRALQQQPQGGLPTQAPPQANGMPPAQAAVNPLTMQPNGPPPGVTTNFQQGPGTTTTFGQ